MTTKEELLAKLNKLEPTKAEDAIEQCMFFSRIGRLGRQELY